jgi:hypothetical protein
MLLKQLHDILLPLLFRSDFEGLTFFSKFSDGIRLLKVKREYANNDQMLNSFSEFEGIDIVVVAFDAGTFQA